MTFLAMIWATAVFCGPPAGGAYFDSYRHAIVVPAYDCRTLTRAPGWAPARFQRESGLGWWTVEDAVFVLAHELGHAHDPVLELGHDIRYVTNCGRPGRCEAFADCYAAGHMVDLARTLGFSGYQARHLRFLAHGSRAGGIGYRTIPQRCFPQTAK